MLTLKFPNELITFIQTSWFAPDKIRRMTVVGSIKMMVYDDVQPSEKIRIYDKRVENPDYYDSFAEFNYAYKYGDIIIPKIEGSEPLNTELDRFLDCIEKIATLISDGFSGLQVMKILEALKNSIDVI